MFGSAAKHLQEVDMQIANIVKVNTNYFFSSLIGAITLFSLITNHDKVEVSRLIGLAAAFFGIVAIRLNIKQNSEKLLSNPVILITMILTSFFVPFSNDARWLFLLGIFLITVFVQNQNPILRKEYLKASKWLIAITLIYELIYRYFSIGLQFLTFGYDNAFHFGLFKGYRLTPQFPFLAGSKWSSDFGLFHVYPPGQAALWSFLANPLVGNSHEVKRELAAFLTISLLCLGLSFAAIYMLFNHTIFYFKSKYEKAVLATVIGLGTYGTLLVNGFPPYVLGGTFMLGVILFVPTKQSPTKIVIYFACTILALELSTPALVLCVLPSALLYSINKIREIFDSGLKNLFQMTAFVGIDLYLFFFSNQKTSATFGWRQILAPGGIQPPNLIESAVLTVIFLIILILFWNEVKNNFLGQFTATTFITFAFLACLTFYYSGAIQYYAVKQFYIWLPLCWVLILNMAPKLKYKSILNVHLLLKVFLILLAILPLTTSKSFTGSFMGTFPKALQGLTNQENFANQVVNEKLVLQALSRISKSNETCLVISYIGHDSDLNSRWLNVLKDRGNISENCFTKFWNSSTVEPAVLYARLNQAKINSTLFLQKGGNFSSSDRPSGEVRLVFLD